MWDCAVAVTMGRVWPVRYGSAQVGIMRVLGDGVSTARVEARKLQSQKYHRWYLEDQLNTRWPHTTHTAQTTHITH